jgi:DNA mismatch endonuclease, patch repair protein
MGLRYRTASRPSASLLRSADLVFSREKVAVMIDGCYWHGCPEHYVASKSNTEYWRQKIAKNQERDADTDARLTAAGWLVLRIWSHTEPFVAALQIRDAVLSRRGAAQGSTSMNLGK